MDVDWYFPRKRGKRPGDPEGWFEDHIVEQFNQYGILAGTSPHECMGCERLNNGCRGQYNAPGMRRFYCIYYIGELKCKRRKR